MKGEEQFKGTIITETNKLTVVGMSKSDNPFWPFDDPFWRVTAFANEFELIKPGHPINGSGAIFTLSAYAIKRSIEQANPKPLQQ
jgi:hypothetical protein